MDEDEEVQDNTINWDAFQLFPNLINVLNDIRNQTEDVEAMRSTLAKNVSLHKSLFDVSILL
jgi:hypothetical protein